MAIATRTALGGLPCVKGGGPRGARDGGIVIVRGAREAGGTVEKLWKTPSVAFGESGGFYNPPAPAGQPLYTRGPTPSVAFGDSSLREGAYSFSRLRRQLPQRGSRLLQSAGGESEGFYNPSAPAGQPPLHKGANSFSRLRRQLPPRGPTPSVAFGDSSLREGANSFSRQAATAPSERGPTPSVAFGDSSLREGAFCCII